MKQVRVGCYVLQPFQVEIYLREGTGADFYFQPEDGRLPRIKVGADNEWQNVVANLLHEAVEMQASMVNCRYQLDNMDTASDRHVFVFNHYQFSLVVEAAGWFLSSCLADLAAAWKRWQRKG